MCAKWRGALFTRRQQLKLQGVECLMLANRHTHRDHGGHWTGPPSAQASGAGGAPRPRPCLLLPGQLLGVAHEAAGVNQQEVTVAPEGARVQPAAMRVESLVFQYCKRLEPRGGMSKARRIKCPPKARGLLVQLAVRRASWPCRCGGARARAWWTSGRSNCRRPMP